MCACAIGQQYDEDGNRIQWWTDESVDNFEERTQCFVDQYSQYELQGYKVTAVNSFLSVLNC